MSTAESVKYNWAKIAHFILEAFAAHDFKAGELRILQIICRETYGRTVSRDDPSKKEFCALRQSYISELTGIPEPSVRRHIANLIKHNVLLRLPPEQVNAAFRLGINTKIQEWGIKLEGRIRERKYPRRWSDGGDHHGSGGSAVIGGDHCGSPIPSMGDPYGSGGGSVRIGGINMEPHNHAGLRSPKEPLNKEPISLEKIEQCSVYLEAQRLADDMFANFTRQWWPITGAPSVLRMDCVAYAEAYQHEPEVAWEAFDAAYSSTIDWQEQNGKRVRKPGEQVLNRAVDLLRKRGIEPCSRGRPRRERSPDYEPGD